MTTFISFTFSVSSSLPGLEKMTEKESAHPTTQQLHDLTTVTANGELVGPLSPQVAPTPVTPEDGPPLPMGTSIQPPALSHVLPTIQDLKLGDKVRGICDWVNAGVWLGIGDWCFVIGWLVVYWCILIGWLVECARQNIRENINWEIDPDDWEES